MACFCPHWWCILMWRISHIKQIHSNNCQLCCFWYLLWHHAWWWGDPTNHQYCLVSSWIQWNKLQWQYCTFGANRPNWVHWKHSCYRPSWCRSSCPRRRPADSLLPWVPDQHGLSGGYSSSYSRRMWSILPRPCFCFLSNFLCWFLPGKNSCCFNK